MRKLERKDNESEEEHEIRVKQHEASVAQDEKKLREIREAFDKLTNRN